MTSIRMMRSLFPAMRSSSPAINSTLIFRGPASLRVAVRRIRGSSGSMTTVRSSRTTSVSSSRSRTITSGVSSLPVVAQVMTMGTESFTKTLEGCSTSMMPMSLTGEEEPRATVNTGMELASSRLRRPRSGIEGVRPSLKRMIPLKDRPVSASRTVSIDPLISVRHPLGGSILGVVRSPSPSLEFIGSENGLDANPNHLRSLRDET